MKTLTFVSIVLLPSTLIAGVMGMNFKAGLFEHPSLFYVTLVIMLALMLGGLLLAWQRRWIGMASAFDVEVADTTKGPGPPGDRTPAGTERAAQGGPRCFVSRVTSDAATAVTPAAEEQQDHKDDQKNGEHVRPPFECSVSYLKAGYPSGAVTTRSGAGAAIRSPAWSRRPPFPTDRRARARRGGRSRAAAADGTPDAHGRARVPAAS